MADGDHIVAYGKTGGCMNWHWRRVTAAGTLGCEATVTSGFTASACCPNKDGIGDVFLRANPTNVCEVIAVVGDQENESAAWVYDDCAGTWGNKQVLGACEPNCGVGKKDHIVNGAFEHCSGDFIAVYTDGTHILYRTWNGTTWSCASTYKACTVPGYITLSPSPTSNKIVITFATCAGAIFGNVWSGTAWGTEKSFGCGDFSVGRQAQPIDFAWESATDCTGMAVFGAGTTLVKYSKLTACCVWDTCPTSLPTCGLSYCPGTKGGFIKAHGDDVGGCCSHDNIVLGIGGGCGKNQRSIRWSGTAWDSSWAASECGCAPGKGWGFDLAWQTGTCPPRAELYWDSKICSAGAFGNYHKQWNSTWGCNVHLGSATNKSGAPVDLAKSVHCNKLAGISFDKGSKCKLWYQRKACTTWSTPQSIALGGCGLGKMKNQGIVFFDGSVGGGSTPIGRTFDIRHDLAVLVNRTFTVRHDIGVFVNRTFNVRHDVLNTVNRSFNIRHDLFNLVGRTFNIRHDLSGQVGRAFDIRHDILNLVNRSFNIRHDILNLVNRTFNVRHDIAQLAGRDFNIRHDIAQFVNRTFNVRHDILNLVNRTFTIRHDIGTFVGRDFNVRHDIGEFVNRTFNIRHDISEFIGRTFNIRHDLLIFVNRTFNLRHDIAQLVNRDFNIRHDIAEFVGRTFNLRHDLSGSVGRIFNIRHDLLQFVNNTFNIRHDIANLVNRTFNIRHDIAQFVGRDFNIRHDISQLINRTFNIRHDITQLVNNTFNVRHDILNLISRDFNIRHDIAELVGRTFNLRHDLAGVVGRTFNIRHDLLILVNNTFNLRHDIAQLVNRTFNIRHDILNLIGRTFNIRHDLSGVVGRAFNIRHDIANLVNRTFTSRHDILNLVGRDFNIRHDILQFVNRTFNIRHDISELIGRTFNIRHDILSSLTAGRTFNIRHDLLTLVNRTFNIRHDILLLVNRTFNLRHDIGQLVGRTFNIRHDIAAVFKLIGITYAGLGTSTILGGVICRLHKDNLDGTSTFVDQVISNILTGVYTFLGIGDDDAQYYVTGWEDVGDHSYDVTDHVLKPEPQ